MMAPTPKTTKMGTNWWERVVVQRSAPTVDSEVTKLTERSPLLQHGPPSPEPVAMLYREEMQLGRLLGGGTYSNVYEVAGLEMLAREEEEPFLDSEARQSLKKTLFDTNGGAKYAIKHLKPDLLKDTKTFEHAACDLIMEAKFLSQLSHPNVLKCRGVAYGGADTFACTGLYDSFFVVMDKIMETLSDRLRRWRLESMAGRATNENSILAKIEIVLQVANALSYLHERRLVFRDLKPQNIGLNADGLVQLFDFGFCRELPNETQCVKNKRGELPFQAFPVEIETTITGEIRDDCHEVDDRLYGMSGKGTLMYMSPEVLGTRQYNRKTDVYGWATIFYEMLTLQRPYTIESVEAHRQAIYKRGERPPLHKSGIPQPIQKLLVNCWTGNIVDRFSMKEAKSHLEFIHSDFTPGLMVTAESFHKCVASSTQQLLSPIHDAIFTIANDIQTGYEDLIRNISGLPHAATAINKDTGTTQTVMVGTTHVSNDYTSTIPASLGSGESFRGDDDDDSESVHLNVNEFVVEFRNEVSPEKSSNLNSNQEEGRNEVPPEESVHMKTSQEEGRNKVSPEESAHMNTSQEEVRNGVTPEESVHLQTSPAEDGKEVPPEGEEIVLLPSASGDSSNLLAVAEEKHDCPSLQKQNTNPQDGFITTLAPKEKQSAKLLTVDLDAEGDSVEPVAARDPQATPRDAESYVIRRRRRALRSLNGTFVYHRYYGHMSLNVGKIDQDHQLYESHRERSLWSIHSLARATPAA